MTTRSGLPVVGGVLIVLVFVAGIASVGADRHYDEAPGAAEMYFLGTGEIWDTMNPGETIHRGVALNGVSEGVGRFEMNLSVTNPSVASIEAVEPGPGVRNFSADISPDGDRLEVSGRDAELTRSVNATFDLFDVAITGEEPGNASIRPDEVIVRNTSGHPYEMTTRPGGVRVTTRPYAGLTFRQSELDSADIRREEPMTVVTTGATSDVESLSLNLTHHDPRFQNVARFVNVSFPDDPGRSRVRFDGRGRYVEVNATGLDHSGSGVVPLFNVTVRGLTEDIFRIEYADVTLRNSSGAEYVIDSTHIGDIQVVETSNEPVPNITRTVRATDPAPTGPAQAANETTAGTEAEGNVDASGPGFSVLAALVAMLATALFALGGRRALAS